MRMQIKWSTQKHRQHRFGMLVKNSDFFFLQIFLDGQFLRDINEYLDYSTQINVI